MDKIPQTRASQFVNVYICHIYCEDTPFQLKEPILVLFSVIIIAESNSSSSIIGILISSQEALCAVAYSNFQLTHWLGGIKNHKARFDSTQ